jgi:hypothetical protein
VPGGGSTRENSAAREDRGVCFEERAIRRLVFLDNKPTSDCGVMSFPKTEKKGVRKVMREHRSTYIWIQTQTR